MTSRNTRFFLFALSTVSIAALVIAIIALTKTNTSTSSSTSTTVANENGFGSSTSNPLVLSVTPSNDVLAALNGALTNATDNQITSKLLTGFESKSGTITPNDSILEAIEKLNGNISELPTTTVLAANGFGSATGPNLSLSITPTGLLSGSSGSIVTASNTDVTSKLLTNYVSTAGTVSATDSILQAIEKLNANTIWYLPISSGVAFNLVSETNATQQIAPNSVQILCGNVSTPYNDATLQGSGTFPSFCFAFTLGQTRTLTQIDWTFYCTTSAANEAPGTPTFLFFTLYGETATTNLFSTIVNQGLLITGITAGSVARTSLSTNTIVSRRRYICDVRLVPQSIPVLTATTVSGVLNGGIQFGP
jgi:hypothetical protein